MIRSPLRYPGGKSKVIKKILALIPDFDEFREPFVGGGSVFIALKQLYPNRKYWINDLYFELYNFWNCAQKDLDAMLRQIWKWKQEFKDGKALHQFIRQNIDKFENLERASAFFVCNRISFSGTTEAGGFSEQAFQKRFTDTSIQRLSLLRQVLEDVKITNLDYEEVVNAEAQNVFLFLDPPYFSATQSALYGKNGNLHKKFDHKRFADVMKRCSHKWLITYDDSQPIRKLFSFANIVEWNLTYGMRNQTESSNQLGREIFIANFEISKQPIGKLTNKNHSISPQQLALW